ncbi:MAG: alanine--tRNA ligase [Nanohaloarchaea archaeon]|nr:alanine--tRNA ligase [Candidatus Nanohaloarchaea archaeon]
MDDKQIKQQLRQNAQKTPDKFYPTSTFKQLGLDRYRCSNCGNYFWSAAERDVCGEPECCGGYSFIGDTPAKEKMDYIQVWQNFSKMFKRQGYTQIKRYPSVARWNPTMDFTIASIAGFQPYVVSGEIKPPANPLVIPQFCIRFSDIENVGITGRHYTGFTMMGQHAFIPSKDYDQDKYFNDIFTWLTKGMKLPKEELVFHEDAWGGGGNFGPSIEFFSRGLELGNQVYMQYERDVKGSLKDLDIKVLDMGMGQERPAWFTHGTETSYEANFGPVVSHLYRRSGISPDRDMLKKFLPYSGHLNLDEVDDINKTWNMIAKKTGYDVRQLKDNILPLSGIYSICDHTRSLLVALTDGALPSNVGGGYNLRALYRRSLDFINRYGWDIDLNDVCRRHAKYLKPQYPELSDNLGEVSEILDVEKKKYYATKEKSQRIVTGLAGKKITTSKLIELYDSNGISPEMLKSSGLKVDVPDDFYALVTERHEKNSHKTKTMKTDKLNLGNIKNTEQLYFDDYLKTDFSAEVAKIIGNDVILDKTCFYPTSGGQAHDTGTINGIKVKDIFKQGAIIIHTLGSKPDFKEGDIVKGVIDKERRIQLSQHHTATHIINGAARKVLGEHIWQAGAEKTEKKARLDITHYDLLTPEQIKAIEKESNDIINKNMPVSSMQLSKDVAEKRYGTRLYQGGAVPGAVLRVIEIKDFDVEACGGTHVKNTGEVGCIKIIGTRKIQDGVIRLEFVAGKKTDEKTDDLKKMIVDISKVLGTVKKEDIVPNCKGLFSTWKELRKIAGIAGYAKRIKKTDPEKYKAMSENVREMYTKYQLRTTPVRSEKVIGDEKLIAQLMRLLNVQREHLAKTVKRFQKEVNDFKRLIDDVVN